MQDTALYQYLLGLQSPWTVSRVSLDVAGQCVDVWAEHSEDAAWVCPHCAKAVPLYDHAEARTWRHLDSCQFQTVKGHPNLPSSGHQKFPTRVKWSPPFPPVASVLL